VKEHFEQSGKIKKKKKKKENEKEENLRTFFAPDMFCRTPSKRKKDEEKLRLSQKKKKKIGADQVQS
jgi:hypothetical protein